MCDFHGPLVGIGQDRVLVVPHPVPDIGAVVGDDGHGLWYPTGVAEVANCCRERWYSCNTPDIC